MPAGELPLLNSMTPRSWALLQKHGELAPFLRVTVPYEDRSPGGAFPAGDGVGFAADCGFNRSMSCRSKLNAERL